MKPTTKTNWADITEEEQELLDDAINANNQELVISGIEEEMKN